MSYKITVKGKVQGVGYRNFAQSIASMIGIKGSVKNLGNGDVEVLVDAHISEEHYKKLLEHLKEGPMMARVDEVLEERGEPREFDGFKIVY